MNNMKKFASILLLIPVCVCSAQTAVRVLNFSKGDAFEKKTVITSACRLRQGTQTLNINSSAAVTKMYTVNDASASNLTFSVATSQITDTINSMGQQMVYNSARPADTSSFIHTALNNIVNNPVLVSVNRHGTISSAARVPVQQRSDVVLAYGGIQQPQYNLGDELDLAAGFVSNAAFTKGFSWTDSLTGKSIKTVITYTIQQTDDANTSVSFDGSITESYFTTNINGVLMIDNATGVIVQKMAQTASSGYNILNGVAYTEERSTSLSEYCIKK